MIFRREHLGQHPAVFRSLTGLTVEAFDRMLPELLRAFAADRRRRLDRPDRQRAPGGGDDFDLAVADQFLLTVVWLRQYPTQECLGYLFGISDSPPCAPSAAACRCWSSPARTACACPTPAGASGATCRRC